MNITLRYAKDSYEAKEAFMSVFEKVFRKIEQYDEDKGDFKNWLSRIAVNECLSLKRKEKRYLYPDNEVEFDSVHEDYVLENLEVTYLLELIQSLKEPMNIIFNMVTDGYKHKEIGEKLGIPESTSRSYYFKARKQLQMLIESSNYVLINKS